MSSSILKRALLASAGLLVGLLLCEGVLRVLGLPRFHVARSAPAQFSAWPDPKTGHVFYVNRADSTIRFEYDSDPRGYFEPGNAVAHRVNATGFRGEPFVPDKSPGALRIAFLGDSFTFGEGVHDRDTFAERTARGLGRRFRDQGAAFESYNFGVGGYNTRQSLFLLENLVLQSHPDAVVLCFVLNDAEPPLFYVDKKGGQPNRRDRESEVGEGRDQQRPPESPLYLSRIAQLVWRARNSRAQNRQTERYYRALYAPDAEGWRDARTALAKMGAFLEERDIPFYVVIFPVLHALDDRHPFSDLYAAVATQARRSGATVLELLPAFEGQSAATLWVHPTDQHPNEQAHQIAAEQLEALLATDPAFRAAMRARAADPPAP